MFWSLWSCDRIWRCRGRRSFIFRFLKCHKNQLVSFWRTIKNEIRHVSRRGFLFCFYLQLHVVHGSEQICCFLFNEPQVRHNILVADSLTTEHIVNWLRVTANLKTFPEGKTFCSASREDFYLSNCNGSMWAAHLVEEGFNAGTELVQRFVCHAQLLPVYFSVLGQVGQLEEGKCKRS